MGRILELSHFLDHIGLVGLPKGLAHTFSPLFIASADSPAQDRLEKFFYKRTGKISPLYDHELHPSWATPDF